MTTIICRTTCVYCMNLLQIQTMTIKSFGAQRESTWISMNTVVICLTFAFSFGQCALRLIFVLLDLFNSLLTISAFLNMDFLLLPSIFLCKKFRIFLTLTNSFESKLWIKSLIILFFNRTIFIFIIFFTFCFALSLTICCFLLRFLFHTCTHVRRTT